ncbi:serine protease 1-like [Platichthys flesus]|uniref:serine protease 1-like n=1 Tax=Platichthys flesus TaxID=8260 RepID=UPI002DBC800C|nr:serine protease 1-like [Platichthys flesus]
MARLTTLLFAMWLGVTVSTVVDLEKRILGGQECGPDERLHHVKLISTGNTNCAGTLISERWIVTAAHCFAPGRTFNAYIGERAGSLQEVRIKEKAEIFNDSNGQEHDLALVKLPKAVVGVKPVGLPDCQHPPKKDARVQLAGRENGSGSLVCVDMHISVCKTYETLKHQHFICTQTPALGAHTGDSGGGVVYQDKIYGVISKGNTKNPAGRPILSMDLCYGPYNQWIRKTIAQP